MAKAHNPADAHRKAQKKRELAKNKEDRKKARDVAVVKKDTRTIEGEIRALNGKASRTASESKELDALTEELARIMKAKADYVEANPDSKKFVFPERAVEAQASSEASGSGSGLYGKDGKLKNPQKSLYYDPIFNPFGAPPPGMPYREKPPTPEEMAALQPAAPPPPITAPIPAEESDDDDDSDDDIAMPAGPPPPPEDSDSGDDSDDIAMPAGPPPAHASKANRPQILIERPIGPGTYQPPRQQQFHPQPFHPDAHMRHPTHAQYQFGVPPPQQQQRPQFGFPPPPLMGNRGLPMRPNQVDPMAYDAPHGLPPNPSGTNSIVAPPSHAPPSAPPLSLGRTSMPSATISAEPQLRDLKKEATIFLPTAMRKRKREVEVMKGIGSINAAPTSGNDEVGDDEQPRERASLMGALKGVGIGPVQPNAPAGGQGKEDYERFKKEMGTFL